MNEEQLHGHWDQLKGKIQQNWGKLTDSDLHFIKGRKTELIGKIIERYGVVKEKAEQEVKRFLDDTD